jgi:hypothetical protein
MTRRRPLPSFLGATALAVILSGTLPSQGFSQDDTGEHDFRLYCSNCHGEGGREILKNHGDREMPVWGVWFKMEAEEDLGGGEGDEGTVQRRITALIDFLETLQAPWSAPPRRSTT